MLNSIAGRLIIMLVLVVVAALQYRYWFGETGYQVQQKLLQSIAAQQEQNQSLIERNRILAAEVYDLKNGTEAIEEYARLDLGLIKPNETFVQMSMINGSYQPIYLDSNQQAQPATETALVEDVIANEAAPPSTASTAAQTAVNLSNQ